MAVKLDLTRSVEELKRVDHLFFVTLKYTRTADVILNTIRRMISAMEYAAEDVMQYLLQKKKIKEIPSTNKEKFEILGKKALSEDDLSFYNYLKKIERSEHTGRDEYRKNVALVTQFVEVDMVMLGDFFEKTQMIISKLAKIK